MFSKRGGGSVGGIEPVSGQVGERTAHDIDGNYYHS